MREKEHEEYNALTKRLLEEGYSAEHHPDYVSVVLQIRRTSSMQIRCT